MARGKRSRAREEDDDSAAAAASEDLKKHRKEETPGKIEGPRKPEESQQTPAIRAIAKGKEDAEEEEAEEEEEEAASRHLLIARCRSVLSVLMEHKHAWLFNEPVDPVALEIPDYPSIIKHPMDLGTIMKKLEKKMYGDLPLDFVHDVRLTFDNAMLYNPPGHDVHNSARKMLAFFEKEWNKSASRSVAVSTPRTPRQHAARPVSSAKAFSFEDKQILLDKLQSLPPDMQHAAVLMMRDRSSHVDWSSDEVNVQLDLFDNQLLQELEDYVVNCMKSSSSRDSKARQASGSKSRGKAKRQKGKGKATEEEDDIGFVIDVPLSLFSAQKVK